jgi:serine acetyltransferase
MGALRRDLIADYLRLYGGRGESRGEARSRAPERFVTNPSLHAVAMIRAALDGPPAAFGLWRQMLLAKHSIDLERDAVVGPGLVLPHPFGLLLTSGSVVGADVMIYHNVTIGEAGGEGPAPVIGDGAIIHTNAVIANGSVIGEGVVVGVNSVVDGEVPAGAVVKRGRIEARRS